MSNTESTLHHAHYPRSNQYSDDWVYSNQMGPNALWLIESLAEVMDIKPGMKILDLGCGKAMTSIFLAKEYGAQVWATDLWVAASENQERITQAGVEDLVFPIHAEAHTLPYAEGFFDAIISIDAYQYFGTDDLYLGYLVDFLKPGGQFGMVSPAMLKEIGGTVPDHIKPYWEWEFCCFHSPEWWSEHWSKTGLVTVDHADAVEDGWKDWIRFLDLSAPHMQGWRKESSVSERAMLEADAGEHFGFVRILASKPEQNETRAGA